MPPTSSVPFPFDSARSCRTGTRIQELGSMDRLGVKLSASGRGGSKVAVGSPFSSFRGENASRWCIQVAQTGDRTTSRRSRTSLSMWDRFWTRCAMICKFRISITATHSNWFGKSFEDQVRLDKEQRNLALARNSTGRSKGSGTQCCLISVHPGSPRWKGLSGKKLPNAVSIGARSFEWPGWSSRR